MIGDLPHLVVGAHLAASLGVVVVALLRRSVRAIVGASAAYRLWGIPLLMALATLVPTPAGGPIAPIVLSAARGLSVAASSGAGPTWPAIVGSVWALGALGCAAGLCAQQARFTAALRDGVRISVGDTLVVRTVRADIGPAVVGRTIALPIDFETRFTPAEQAAILAHEARHLARGDVIVNAVVALIQCLCWFNPLAHLAARWLRFDQELACDAEVIAQRPNLRRPYAEALLKTQTLVAIPPAGCAWRARGFPALRDRIRLLKQQAPSLPRRVCGVLLVAAAASAGAYAAWAAQPARSQPTVTAPDWSKRPNGADLVRFYPREALARGTGGLAVVQCRVAQTGALTACALLREGPQGAGFGAAALQMAPLFQMKPMSRDGKPVGGGIVRIPIKFRAPAGARGQS